LSLRASRKVTIGLKLGALITKAMDVACLLAKVKGVDVVLTILFSIIIPVAILVINVVVAIQVRRAAIHSAANLGVQPHHQSTSAVPTVMLITTSLIYVLFNVTATVLYVVRVPDSGVV